MCRPLQLTTTPTKDRRLLLDGLKETMPKKTADTHCTCARKCKVHCVLALTCSNSTGKYIRKNLLAIPAHLY
jgi:hypothetical protein